MTRKTINETTRLAYDKWFVADLAVSAAADPNVQITDEEFTKLQKIADDLWADYRAHDNERRREILTEYMTK